MRRLVSTSILLVIPIAYWGAVGSFGCYVWQAVACGTVCSHDLPDAGTPPARCGP